MPTLQIRNLPDDVYQALAFRAERAQRSLAQQALVELRGKTAEQSQTRQRVLTEIKRNLTEMVTPAEPSPEALIREDRGR
ncbi:hypothetical protein TVNIR_0037 [Thioalkalivibrio nitratireducens DSM 14787]|uniref:Antitoxin FitA-like ribbon-helix-helix domain-containing protein n=2 Tax=Thioalkalivibrio TaxID=106633 RepID=W0DIZ4_9GAMM|nr:MULTISPECIES: hypothetical protein [Thioalkalivibrio]AGA31752.1 hypothetical protein TVNIR_0037 [Thioalkalivibrio nitratireducens DSM 14787]AHE96973.1 hypothetical protein THITH_00335 [Thioalkalivibrio paradoxus ARh 1]